MIICNKEFHKKTFSPAEGVEIPALLLGERGRGRTSLPIPLPSGIEKLTIGENPDVSFGKTRSGRIRIVEGGKDIGIILCSKGGYTRRGNGRIKILPEYAVTLLGRGNGADGDAGRIGSWPVEIYNITGHFVAWAVTRSGGGENPHQYGFVVDGVGYGPSPFTAKGKPELGLWLDTLPERVVSNEQIQIWDQFGFEAAFIPKK